MENHSFLADGVKITSRSSDGTLTLSFTNSEYQRKHVLDAFSFAQSCFDQGVPVRIVVGEDHDA